MSTRRTRDGGEEQDPPEAEATADGRRLRREAGRVAVLDATIDLVFEGFSPPTVEQIAGRAGVSVASVFRYFRNLSELRDAGVRRYLERFDHLLEIPDIGEHSLERRIDHLVEARLHLYETAEPIAKLAHQLAPDAPEIDATLRRVRATMADQLRQHFAQELDALDSDDRRERLAVLSALLSFSSWGHLTSLGLSRPALAHAWHTHLAVLLDPELVLR